MRARARVQTPVWSAPARSMRPIMCPSTDPRANIVAVMVVGQYQVSPSLTFHSSSGYLIKTKCFDSMRSRDMVSVNCDIVTL